MNGAKEPGAGRVLPDGLDDRRAGPVVAARPTPDGGPVGAGEPRRFRQLAGDVGVEPGQVVDVDAARADVVALGDLGGAEMPPARPQRPAPGPGQLPVGSRLPGRPAARDLPRIEPAED